MTDQSEPPTARLDADYVKSILDGADMYALSDLLISWADNEFGLDPEQRDRLSLLAGDYRIVADQCGRDWKASGNTDSPNVLKFLVELAANKALESNSADEDDLGYTDVEVFLANLAAKMIEILNESEAPHLLRSELLRSAESAGYWHYNNGIRGHSHEIFAHDLLADNPIAALWAREARKWVIPDNIADECQLLHALDPISPGFNSI
jgi:hypothetical protein